jgi:Xaa-Pro aminopeptidase
MAGIESLPDPSPVSAKSETLLMVADSERDANMLYAVGMFAPDPFIYLRGPGKPVVVLNDLEVDRARRVVKGARVLPMSQLANRLRRNGAARVGLPHLIRELLRERRLRRIVVPSSFPHGLARQLRDLKVKVRARQGMFFPQRAIKTPEEVRKIAAALTMAEVGISEAIQVLRRSKVGRGGTLMHHGFPLTSEKLQAVINIAIIQAGGMSHRTIVAGGKQACDPHESGHGPLHANEPIIIDVFPRSQRTGYFGDISRTLVKGRASEAARKLYHTVTEGQKIAFAATADGAACSRLHERVSQYFESQGYKTTRTRGRLQGFYHGLGHGVGLELHEAPRISMNSDDILETGNVIALEPGLYYPRVGGVRIEDVVVVTENGCKNLTKCEKVFEL